MLAATGASLTAAFHGAMLAGAAACAAASLSAFALIGRDPVRPSGGEARRGAQNEDRTEKTARQLS